MVRVAVNLDTLVISTSVKAPTTEPSLAETKGVWVRPDLIAWPADALPVDPSLMEFRLHWGAKDALEVDAEDITGGDSDVLHLDRRGLPGAVLAAHPGLAGYLALRVERDTTRKLPAIASGDVAVGAYFGGRLEDAGRVDVTAVK